MKLRKNNQHGLEIMGRAPVEFHSLGPVNYTAARLLTWATSEKFASAALNNPDIAGIVTTREIAMADGWPRFDGWIVSDDPQADFFRFHNWLAEVGFYGGCENLSRRNGWDDPDKNIAPVGVVVEDGVIIQPGAVIGYPGARWVTAKSGERIYVIHVGGVHICEGARVGANSVIVQSVWPRPTLVGKNAFIGNLVNVGHNAQVGEGAAVLSGAILGGGCEIGAGATVDLGAIVRPHVKVGPGAHVTMGSVVTQDVPTGVTVTGNWAIEHGQFVNDLKDKCNG